MENKRKPYARYNIIRGHHALWKGDPSEDGSLFRQLVITSNQFNSTEGTFQVYGLEGTGKGIKNGKLAVSEEEPRILIDKDFSGLEGAAEEFDRIVKDAHAHGFKTITMFDELQFQAKLHGHGQ